MPSFFKRKDYTMDVNYDIAQIVFHLFSLVFFILLGVDIYITNKKIKKLDGLMDLVKNGEVSYIRAVADLIKLTAPKRELKKLEAKEQSPALDSKQLVEWNEYKKALEKTQSQ